MSKAGRKRAEGLREANGRMSRASLAIAKGAPPAEAKRLRDAAVAGIRDAAYGWEIGRLFLAGSITAAEFAAGKRYRMLVDGWRRLDGGPLPDPKPAALGFSTGGGHVDPDSFEGSKQAAAAAGLKRDLLTARAAFRGLGPLVATTLEDACLADRAVVGPHSIAWLRDGLAALANHWGLRE